MSLFSTADARDVSTSAMEQKMDDLLNVVETLQGEIAKNRKLNLGSFMSQVELQLREKMGPTKLVASTGNDVDRAFFLVSSHNKKKNHGGERNDLDEEQWPGYSGWHETREICKSIGGDLATVTDKVDQTQLQKLIKDYACNSAEDRLMEYWILEEHVRYGWDGYYAYKDVGAKHTSLVGSIYPMIAADIDAWYWQYKTKNNRGFICEIRI